MRWLLRVLITLRAHSTCTFHDTCFASDSHTCVCAAPVWWYPCASLSWSCVVVCDRGRVCVVVVACVCCSRQATAQLRWDRSSAFTSADPGNVLGGFTVDGKDERKEAFAQAARAMRDETDWECAQPLPPLPCAPLYPS